MLTNQSISDILSQSRQRCLELRLDPKALPEFIEFLSPGELRSQLDNYEEVLDVVHFFVQKFLGAVYGTPILIGVTDDQGYLLKLNGDPSILETTIKLGMKEGARFHETVGTNAASLCLQYDRPIEIIGDEHYHHVLHGIACYSVPLHTEDRRLLGSLTFMTPVHKAHRYLPALLCTIADSIERELLLRASNTRLHILNQVLLNTGYHGVIITNIHGHVMDCNEQLDLILQALNPGHKTWLGSSIFLLEPVGLYFKQVLTDNEECVGRELSLSIHGTERHFILDVVPIYDHNRSLIRVVGNLRDISGIKETEQLLRNAEKLAAAGQLAAGIAHEIRNPLATVQGLFQLSRSNFQPYYYDLIMSELARMNSIVSEFLHLGKPQAIAFKEEDCLSILQDVLSVYETQITMNGIAISTNVVCNRKIYCDANQIKQVFNNLLKNSMEALPYGGNITIELRLQNSRQLIRFMDDGEGMPPEVLKTIGQPFRSTKKNGNGLGIMVSKKIIESHQGEIHFQSEVDAGTTVEIFLPYV